jgi:hypothetical protein
LLLYAIVSSVIGGLIGAAALKAQVNANGMTRNATLLWGALIILPAPVLLFLTIFPVPFSSIIGRLLNALMKAGPVYFAILVISAGIAVFQHSIGITRSAIVWGSLGLIHGFVLFFCSLSGESAIIDIRKGIAHFLPRVPFVAATFALLIVLALPPLLVYGTSTVIKTSIPLRVAGAYGISFLWTLYFDIFIRRAVVFIEHLTGADTSALKRALRNAGMID